MDAKSFLEKFGQDPITFLVDRFKEGFDYLLVGDLHGENALTGLIVTAIPYLKRLSKPFVYLELEDHLQKYIDSYLATGNENALKKIAERDKELAIRGYPSIVTGRNYLDIIRESRKQGVKIIAIDVNRDGDTLENVAERDKHMKRYIRSPGLVYAGNGHVSILFNLKEKKEKYFTIHQEVDVRRLGSLTFGFTAEMDPHLDGLSVAFDLRDPEIKERIMHHVSEVDHIGIQCKTDLLSNYQGLIYHSVSEPTSKL